MHKGVNKKKLLNNLTTFTLRYNFVHQSKTFLKPLLKHYVTNRLHKRLLNSIQFNDKDIYNFPSN